MGIKIYEIHDNYAIPFIVINDDMNKVIKILRNKEIANNVIENNVIEKNVIILETKYEKIFTGEPFLDIYHKLYTFEIGNTILIYLGKYKYIYIGSCIYTFETEQCDNNLIHSYYSPIGNNDVPYPYAVSKNNIYLMAENIIIDNQNHRDNQDNPIDPYCLYYDYKSQFITKRLQYNILGIF